MVFTIQIISCLLNTTLTSDKNWDAVTKKKLTKKYLSVWLHLVIVIIDERKYLANNCKESVQRQTTLTQQLTLGIWCVMTFYEYKYVSKLLSFISKYAADPFFRKYLNVQSQLCLSSPSLTVVVPQSPVWTARCWSCTRSGRRRRAVTSVSPATATPPPSAGGSRLTSNVSGEQLYIQAGPHDWVDFN